MSDGDADSTAVEARCLLAAGDMSMMGMFARIWRAIRRRKVRCRPVAAGSLVGIVGESQYQRALAKTARHLRPEPPLEVDGYALEVHRSEDVGWFLASLLRGDDPKYPEAIAVWSDYGKIGHLSAETAIAYGPVLMAVRETGADGAACSGFLRRADNGMWGAVLALSLPEVCLEQLRLEMGWVRE